MDFVSSKLIVSSFVSPLVENEANNGQFDFNFVARGCSCLLCED